MSTDKLTQAQIKSEIAKMATLDNARAYLAEVDQWVFCLELLGMSCATDGDNACDSAIQSLEWKFDRLLEQAQAPKHPFSWH